MNFDTDFIKSKLKDISSIALKTISEKDLEKVKGNATALAALFQEKLGISREEASKKVDELLAKYPPDEMKQKAQKTAGMALSMASSLLDQVKEKIKK